MNEATTHEAEIAPDERPSGPSGVELWTSVLLLAFGLYFAQFLRAYDADGWMAVAMGALCVVSSFVVCWAGLRVLGVARAPAAAASLRAQLAWNVLLLGQLAYVGYLLAPLELGVATVLMARRTQRRAWGKLMVVAITARVVSLALVELVRWLAGVLQPLPGHG